MIKSVISIVASIAFLFGGSAYAPETNLPDYYVEEETSIDNEELSIENRFCYTDDGRMIDLSNGKEVVEITSSCYMERSTEGEVGSYSECYDWEYADGTRGGYMSRDCL